MPKELNWAAGMVPHNGRYKRTAVVSSEGHEGSWGQRSLYPGRVATGAPGHNDAPSLQLLLDIQSVQSVSMQLENEQLLERSSKEFISLDMKEWNRKKVILYSLERMMCIETSYTNWQDPSGNVRMHNSRLTGEVTAIVRTTVRHLLWMHETFKGTLENQPPIVLRQAQKKIRTYYVQSR